MLIINADDWGRTTAETNAALASHATRRITSVTAMVFMQDSERAAELALEHGLDVGLHLNFSQPFTSGTASLALAALQERVCRFINANKYAFMVYNPLLRRDFIDSYRAQKEMFLRLYGRYPTHVDGHHHKHLCANVLLGNVIPEGEKVRRNFYFWPGEKSLLNRAYRSITDGLLARRYQLTDYFFALSQCLEGDRLDKVMELARTHTVEVMTHPANPREQACLMSDRYQQLMVPIEQGSYACL